MTAVPTNLATLIDPMDVDDFLASYWGKQRLLISSNDANRYAYLLAPWSIDDLVSFGRWCFAPDRVRPAESERVVRGIPSEITGAVTRHLELRDLRTFYQQGKTIVLTMLQLRLPSVATLGRGVEQALQCPVNVNMYLTPPGATGFPPHFDDHDIFVCQLEGTKIWRFYESGRELPLRFEGRTLDDTLTAEPIGECRLCPGDLLYLPRGVGHGAFTEDERSLHLTFSAQVFRWAELLERAIACTSRNDVALREALPIGWVGDHKTRTAVRGQLRQLLQVLADGALRDDGLHDLSIRFVDDLSELADGSVAESLDLAGVEVETLMEKRAGNICVVTCEGDLATIYFPGGDLKGPSMIAEALDFVASVDRPFHVFELPGAMSTESKKVLVRRLAKEGLLRRVDARPPLASENA
jgi:hypothetical protein